MWYLPMKIFIPDSTTEDSLSTTVRHTISRGLFSLVVQIRGGWWPVCNGLEKARSVTWRVRGNLFRNSQSVFCADLKKFKCLVVEIFSDVVAYWVHKDGARQLRYQAKWKCSYSGKIEGSVCGYETWSFTLRKELRLRGFENRVKLSCPCVLFPGACGSLGVEAVCYKPEGRGIASRWGGFFF
jgi:hypothetical protein